MKRTKNKFSEDKMVAANKIRRKSKMGGSVKLCWDIFSELKQKLGEKLTRKHAMEVAVGKGIAFYTVRTQWQEWRQAGDRDVATHERLYGASNPHILG